jgi:hypothetical protein
MRMDDAIEGFDRWHQPWIFREQVLKSLQSEERRAQFERIWQEATQPAHWRSGDLAASQAALATRLAALFELSQLSATAIARAAAYDWK